MFSDKDLNILHESTLSMEIDKQLVAHVAKVARLHLTEKEVEEFLPQLKEVLATFEQVSEVDTENVEPSFQPLPLKSELRDDVVKSSLSQEDALKNSANTKDGYFKGPRAV
jgi:aspartyl-tRNA(Asn)/glutamyl-tRNA(Gln) amidotransferase subunit C